MTIASRLHAPLPLAVCAILALSALPRVANAWAIGSQINGVGCHEPITAQALRNVRMHRAGASVITPTRDEAALIDDVLFSPPADFIPDLAGMTLLLGVRDNDLKGINPLSSLDLIQVHGNPSTQEEHCIRSGSDDGSAGDQSALAACRTFIRDTAVTALAGLDTNGMVDPTKRTDFTLYVALAGKTTLPLPLFYVKMGAAMHALEDGFTHAYRTSDGMNVTVVLNWIDLVGTTPYDEARDGPGHKPELDHCWQGDPLVARNFDLATQAATELLSAALDPALSPEEKAAKFDDVTAKYLTYQPGCTIDNNYCDAPETRVTGTLSGCNVGGVGGTPWGAFALVGLAVLCLRRPRWLLAASTLMIAAALSTSAYADTTPPAPTSPAAAPAIPVTTVAPVAVAAEPAVEPGTASGKEPGRDIKSPTVAEVQAVREDKKLGKPLGFTGSLGGSVERPGAVVSIGMRYRLNESWLIGVDAGWNPWITTAPIKERSGVAMLYGTLIKRFPMKFDRVNLRSSLHLGVSTLLFDVYGAPKYSTGPYFAFSPLGIDYDLGNSVRLVVDPVELAIPVPLLGQLPLYYEQFRFMIGIQVGA